MKFVKKVIQDGGEFPKPNPIRDRYRIKIENLLKIMAKLAKIQGYDENWRIRNQKGQFIDDTNVAALLTYAMSPGKVLNGEQNFIDLLNEAGVSEELVLNEAIKAKLKRSFPVINEEVEPRITFDSSVVPPRKPMKRKHDDFEEDSEKLVKEQSSNKRKFDFDDEISNETNPFFVVEKMAPLKRKLENNDENDYKRKKMEGSGFKWIIPKF